QAEDGIRDRNVTGVQTCALPILDWSPPSELIEEEPHRVSGLACGPGPSSRRDASLPVRAREPSAGRGAAGAAAICGGGIVVLRGDRQSGVEGRGARGGGRRRVWR